ncbi:hypothetical protein ABG067_001466 [Albugo candida]
MQRTRKTTTTPTKNATTATTMKRVGGGFVLRTPPTVTTPARTQQRPSTTPARTQQRPSTTTARTQQRPSTTPARTQQRPSTTPARTQQRPSTTTARTQQRPSTTTARTQQRPSTTSSTLRANVPRNATTANVGWTDSTNDPVMRAGTGARVAAASGARVSAVPTPTRIPAMPADPTSENQPRLRQLVQLKKENVQLSRALETKSTQLRSATEKIGSLKTVVQELNQQLEVSRQRNQICQRKLDYAYKTHKDDGYKLKELTDGHTILKSELSRSKAMLDEFKVFMEQQQRQLMELKHEGDLKTSELTETETALMQKMELQHQHDQEKIKQLEQVGIKSNAEILKSRSVLDELLAFMEDHLSYLKVTKEAKEKKTSCALQNQAAENRSTDQEAAVYEHACRHAAVEA